MAEKEPTKAASQEEMVTISKGQLDGLMQRLESLEVGRGIKKPKRVTEHFARVRFHDGKPVVKYDGYKEKEEDGKRVAYINIHLYETKEPITVKYLEFLNSNNSVEVKIVKQEATEVVQNEGKIRTRNPDEAKISSKNFESSEIDLEVTSYIYMVTVEVLEGETAGKQYTFDSSALNA